MPASDTTSFATEELLICQASALCPICNRTLRVTKARLLYPHGPTNNRCLGSFNFPADPSPLPAHSPYSPALGPTTTHDATSAATPRTPSSLRLAGKILKRTPRASRFLAGNSLVAILRNIFTKSSVVAWDRIFRFPSCCLRIPKRGGHGRSLTSEGNRQLRDVPVPSQPLPRSRRDPFLAVSSRDPLHSLATRVATRLEKGDYKGAVHLACCEDSVAVLDEGAIAALKLPFSTPRDVFLQLLNTPLSFLVRRGGS